jgi:4-hydroxy-3-polyprenylbenzoate decarboxylase
VLKRAEQNEAMNANDLRSYVALLESRDQLIRVSQPVSTELEITEIIDRVSKGPVERFPTLHVTAITRRSDPICPATVVGIPPMEDYWMGKATERLFLPLVQLFLPEVIDFAMPAPGVFHNLVLVSIEKQFPGQARKVIHGLWGLALLSLAKGIVVVDEWVDVHNPMEAAWQALGNVDWSRDVMISDGPVDHLDHASYHHSFGGKIGVDATAKLPEEGYTRGWPEVVRMDPEVEARIDTLWTELGLD